MQHWTDSVGIADVEVIGYGNTTKLIRAEFVSYTC